MKRAKVLMLLLIFSLLFSACNSRKQSTEEIPDDFEFVYTHNFTEVDTFNSTIKNRFHFDEGDPNAITDFTFSDEQLQKIYEAFIKYDIQDLPDAYERLPSGPQVE